MSKRNKELLRKDYTFYLTGGFVEEYWPHLKKMIEGYEVRVRHDTENRHDPTAMGVYDIDGNLLGFVPKNEKAKIRALQDAAEKYKYIIRSNYKEGSEWSTAIDMQMNMPAKYIMANGAINLVDGPKGGLVAKEVANNKQLTKGCLIIFALVALFLWILAA